MPGVSKKCMELCGRYDDGAGTMSEAAGKIMGMIEKNENIKYSYETVYRAVRELRKKPQKKSIDIDPPPSLADNYGFCDVHGNNVLLIGDTQIPFHDTVALKTAVTSGEYDTIILAGDMIDFHGLSWYERNPKFRDLQSERMALIQFYRYLRYYHPDAKIYYLEGNHEYRLTRWLWEHPELANVNELQAEEFLRCRDFDITYVSGQTIRIGKLNVIHGHEMRGGGIQPAKNLVQKGMENIITFHYHKTQEWVEQTIDGSMIGGWSVGCLCALRPRWLPINKWNHGFAVVRMKNDGFTVENRKIKGTKIY